MFPANLKRVPFLLGIAKVLKKRGKEKLETVGSAAINPIFVQFAKLCYNYVFHCRCCRC